jgi:hydrogenase maturation protease
VEDRPGTLVELGRDRLPRWFAAKISPHQIDLKEVLALAELRGTLPEATVAIGLQPGVIDLSVALSPQLAGQMDDLVSRVIERLDAWGHAARRVTHA